MEARSQSAAHPNEMNFIFNLNAFSWKPMKRAVSSRCNFSVFATDPPVAYLCSVRLNSGNDERHNRRMRPQQRDVLCSGTKMFLFWCLPSFAFALGFFVSPGLKTVLWTLSLGFMGTVCLLNASRCGRIHCYFTGPFFIVGLLVPWDMVLGCYHLGRPDGNGLVT